jgi:serine/threonine protein kinase/tetratricopeptide (TPR) repeat protein
MTLSGLSATELARIDSVCLDFESQLRGGHDPSIEQIVNYHGGENAELLRVELGTIRQQVLDAIRSPQSPAQDTLTAFAPFGTGSPAVAAESSMANLPSAGTRLGPYQIERQIGRGGMGVVFSAHDHRLGRKVAIKLLSSAIAGRKDLIERFDREARAVAAITHPNIVELFDVGVHEGLPYAVMEFLDGITLEDYLDQATLSPSEVRRFGTQIADALATAHAAGVIHRDLKPQNIMLVGGDATGRGSSVNDPLASSLASVTDSTSVSGNSSGIHSGIAKLFDFGLSRVEPQTANRADSLDQEMERTSEGMIMGTPGYMAPEQATGEAVTASADLFSLGCILYEAFYGKRAFDGRTKSQRITAAISETPTGNQHRRAADPQLAQLIDDCLQKRPEMRPENASVIAERLRTSGGVPPMSRRRWFMLAGSGAALLVGGGAAGAIINMQSQRKLRAIRSLAVLSFVDQSDVLENNQLEIRPDVLQPVGQSPLSPGETLPGLLVHELTRLPDLIVPSFRPATANSPSEYRQLGARMEVDAMLTGTVRRIESSTLVSTAKTPAMWDLDLQLISSETGTQIWGGRIRTVAGEHLLAQTQAASEIAKVIGRQLTATADGDSVPAAQAFHCLVDGKMRSDPDSVCGLERALMCFEKAHQADATYVDPIAGIALTSITLAAQSSPEKAIELTQRSLQRSREALAIDKMSVDARLAKLMVDWQMIGRYAETDAGFKELLMTSPDHWQIHHQYALFLLASQRTSEAISRLREASLLSPLSISIRVDLARAYWLDGDTERAIADAQRILARAGGQRPATGLLIDIYEQRRDFKNALALDPQIVDASSPLDAESYWAQRRTRLTELPYGSFGEKVNELIWYGRAGKFDDVTLADYLEPRTPMLPMVLAVHPSLAEARKVPRAIEVLPALA